MPSEVTPGEYFTVLLIYPPGVKSGSEKLSANLYPDGETPARKKISSAVLFDAELDPKRQTKAALITPPSTASPGPARVKIESASGVIAEIPITIKPRDFIAEEIPLNPANTNLRTEPDPRKTAESQRLWNILSTTGAEVRAAGRFITPVDPKTRRSSFFGDRRVYKYSDGKKDTSVHAGIDYAVPTGTKVAACADGLVILAKPRIVTGNSIVLEHLPGVYSIYYHLSEINVKEGETVHSGDIIGLSGSTGLSTGPHLHWEIRVATENSDPDAFVRRAPLERASLRAALQAK